VHNGRAIGTLVAAIGFYIGSLLALLFSQPILAVVLMLAGLHFNMHSHRHLAMGEIVGQTCAIAHLVASLNVEARDRAS
jgi:hypothetical protein